MPAQCRPICSGKENQTWAPCQHPGLHLSFMWKVGSAQGLLPLGVMLWEKRRVTSIYAVTYAVSIAGNIAQVSTQQMSLSPL